MSKKQEQLNRLKKYRYMPKLEYGMYVEVYGYCGYFEKTDGDYIYIRTSKGIEGPFHPTSDTIYYDSPINKNIIYDWRNKKQ